jgi:deoxyribodipyrimidine photo-lyase
MQVIQRLPVPPDQAWALFADPRNLARLTPPWLGFEITSPIPKRIYAGVIVTYRLRPFPGDRLDVAGTSRLSPYLRAGILSAREVVAAAMRGAAEAPTEDARRSAQRWLDELIWKEFYAALLFHRPLLRSGSLRPRLRHFPWINNAENFAAWTAGRTGYPVVDAAIRQLRAVGWIPNRARMIVASFLVKDLLIDWRRGARYFMRRLVDGDPASNSGGWQWVAGTGTDAAPHFRIFNPTQQGWTWDPEGTCVRRWVPELTAVPAQYIHAPWRMPQEVQHHSGCAVGTDYPIPIVDHAAARQRALAVSRGILTSRNEAALRRGARA